MSKYCKLEDVKRVIDDAFDSIPMEQTIEILQARRNIRNLPTIEVSEDAISREWLIKRFKDIVEHYKMRIKRTKRYGKKTSYDTSEQIGYWKDEIADYNYFIREIENAPSVVPKPKEGEWVVDISDYLGESKFCPNCGARMKGADDEV